MRLLKIFAVLLVSALSAPFAFAQNSSHCGGKLVKVVTAQRGEVLVKKYVADALKNATKKNYAFANECLWKAWLQRDGAAVKELVSDFLLVAERNPEIFISVASRSENDIQSLLDMIYLGFVANSALEARKLQKFKQSWLGKLSSLKPKANQSVEAKNIELCIKQLSAIKVQLID